MPATKLLILGIDGANPDLLLQWSAEGHLSNLGKLLRRGQFCRTLGLEGFFIGSTWPSIYTGVGPAQHGFHYLTQLRAGTYDLYQPAEHGLFRTPPFWTELSRQGQRLAILDAPMCPLEPSLNGVQLVEWGAHDEVFGFGAQPPELANLVRSQFGAHPVGSGCDGERRTAEDYARFVDSLVEGVETRSRLTRHVLAEGRWDLLMQVFSEAHCAGHQLWHLHDESHPGHDASVVEKLGDPLQRVCVAIDKAIGEIIQDAGDCLVFVFSSHGMSYWHGASFLLADILFRLGVAQRPEGMVSARSSSSVAWVTAQWLWWRLPEPIRAIVRRFRGPVEKPLGNPESLPTLDFDAHRSQCFPHRNGLPVAGIRLNLIDREPTGALRPGKQAEEFCETLIADLLDVVDDRTGRPVIQRVAKTSELYAGRYLSDLPDLLVVFNEELPTGSVRVGNGRGALVRVSSPKIGKLARLNTYTRSGDHRRDGLLVVDGPGVSPGALPDSVSILDLAPTWAHALGVKLSGVEGTPIASLRCPD